MKAVRTSSWTCLLSHPDRQTVGWNSHKRVMKHFGPLLQYLSKIHSELLGQLEMKLLLIPCEDITSIKVNVHQHRKWHHCSYSVDSKRLLKFLNREAFCFMLLVAWINDRMSKLKLIPCCSVARCSSTAGTNLLSEMKVNQFSKDKSTAKYLDWFSKDRWLDSH